MGPMQMFTLRVRLVGRANTLENVGRNVWLYTKKKNYIIPYLHRYSMFCNLRYSFDFLTEVVIKL